MVPFDVSIMTACSSGKDMNFAVDTATEAFEKKWMAYREVEIVVQSQHSPVQMHCSTDCHFRQHWSQL